MSRYIEADRLRNNIYCRASSASLAVKTEALRAYTECVQAIDEQPTIEARKVVHGEWVHRDGDSRFMCSVCKCSEDVPTVMGEPIVWWYCPHCGADMRGGVNNEVAD